MADAFVTVLRRMLPPETAVAIEQSVLDLERCDFLSVFQNDISQQLLGRSKIDEHAQVTDGEEVPWKDEINQRLNRLLSDVKTSSHRKHFFLVLAYAALQAFLQSNVTGPPLPFSVDKVLWPTASEPADRQQARIQLIQSLEVDGVSAYRLVPNIELFVLSDTILASPMIDKSVKAACWAKLRCRFVHQRLLSETSSTLQASVYESIAAVDSLIEGTKVSKQISSSFSIEQAAIDIHYGDYKSARSHLEDASNRRGFVFALTGRLGKRTKYQERNASQLVVLARSAPSGSDVVNAKTNGLALDANLPDPRNLKLNDDTLLESVEFVKDSSSATNFEEATTLPESLKSLDANSQPLLHPLDSTVLLQLAASITNTSPTDGLTREETLPYAQRVLDGGNSNWQVYTQALLIRSRIEGYRSRTVERGLLQLQALVDQVIADTTAPDEGPDKRDTDPQQYLTFLPRPNQSESAPASARLQYVHLLTSPTRWELEIELAARWISLGGLRSALEIYERLEMWAEVALCWAATDREEKAKRIIRRELNNTAAISIEPIDSDEETWQGPPRNPVPADAPRLYCILGDIDNDISMYEKAWEVSNHRYARAQRSVGRLYFSAKDHIKAADAYTKALEVNQLNGSSWFALGCSLLELSQFDRAVEAFARAVQIDDTDAEAWSNLAASLLKRGPPADEAQQNGHSDASIQPNGSHPKKAQKHKRDALRAFKRASSLKYDSPRIWDNVLTVAASLVPPSYADILAAQIRLIDLQASAQGESCIDEDIIDGLVRYVVASYPSSGSTSTPPGDGEPSAEMMPNRPGSIPALVIKMMTTQVVPLITRSPRLWRSVATLFLWQRKPTSALNAHEKAWRATTSPFDYSDTDEKAWNGVVEATVQLMDAYESLGPMERTEGLAAGSGELVAKDWRFKARSAIRGVLGKARETWEGSEGWGRLQGSLEALRAGG